MKYNIFAIVIQNILKKLRSKIYEENENEVLSLDNRELISKVAEISFEMCY